MVKKIIRYLGKQFYQSYNQNLFLEIERNFKKLAVRFGTINY